MLPYMRCVSVVLIASLAGCTPICRNKPLDQRNTNVGYRFDLLDIGENNTDSVFICLTFSGGGTRAAALAYGVLQGLRDTAIAGLSPTDPPRCLLDEVDLISSVSGGSFTATGYGLWRGEVFDGRLESRFLKRDIQWYLLCDLWKPKNLLRLPLVLLDRIEVAACYYHEEIFDKKTYGDLLKLNRRPYVVVNATDLARGQRFSFTQDDFDMLGSDLSSLPVGWSVAASSAFPMVLSPLRLKYYPGDAMSDTIKDALTAPENRRDRLRCRWANSLLARHTCDDANPYEIDAENHRYLYLMDGGLVDNLGLTYVIREYRTGFIRERIENGRIDKLVVVIVDAVTEPPEDLESKAIAPGLFKVGVKTGTTGMDNYSAALTEIVRHELLEVLPQMRKTHESCRAALRESCPEGMTLEEALPKPPAEALVDAYVIDINFRRITDERKRRSFLSIITSFFLPSEDVRGLIEEGRRLAVEHPELRRLISDLE